MKLHIIGSGCPVPTAERVGSAFGLEVDGEILLVDCGPATTHKMARMGLRLLDVERVFLTHHHFDHNVDLPCFALSRWDLCKGGEPSLKVFGPPPTETFVERLLGREGAYVDDWVARIEHPASHEVFRQRGGVLPRPAPSVEAKDVGPGEVLRTDAFRVTARRVHHCEPQLESLAYRFDTDAGSVVFAGDCGDCPELRALATGADTLVVACTHYGTMHPDLTDVITGTPEVPAIAAEAGVKRVVLTHASPGFAGPVRKERAIAEIARAWDGEIIFPDELVTLDLA